MPTYKYRAVTDRGQVVESKIEAANRLILLKKLKKNQLSPIDIRETITANQKQVKKQRKNVISEDSIVNSIRRRELEQNMSSEKSAFSRKVKDVLLRNAKISKRDLVVFTQNFYLLKKANFNNIHALSTVIDTIENRNLKMIIEDVLLGVEAGETMSSTMEYYTGVFPQIYINMIKVGEMSGALTNALQQAVKYLDDSESLNKKVKGILVPNLIQFIALSVLLVVGTVVSIPMIQNVFDSVGTTEELPWITQAFSNFLNSVTSWWYIPTIIIAGVVIAIVAYIKTPKGTYKFHYFKYTMPIFGKLLYAIDFSRLIQSIVLNLKNGMRVQDALETSKHVSNNLVMISLVETAINNILVGQSWIEPFEKSGLSTPMISEMLKIGMQTDLAEMMDKLLEYMAVDIDMIMQRVIKVLPQIIYAIVGAMLIFVTVVVLVPLIQVYMGTWMFSAYDV